MNYYYLITHKELFPYAVGITYQQFELLLPKFSTALRKAEHKKAYEKERLRDVGGGRKSILKTDRQKLFFILLYYKIYPTLRFAELLFELDHTNVYRWKEFLEQVLFEALGYQLELPEVKVNGLTGVSTVCPLLKEFIVDASERPINRPQDPQKQRDYYSGKKKRHTIKNQLLVHPKSKRILSVSLTVEGRVHDKKLFEKDPAIYRAPPKAKGLGDLGYEGAKEVNSLVAFMTPFKKPRGKQLSEAQKATNKALSSIRVRVEHVFSYMKHFAVLSHPFRGNISKADQPFVNIACLYNFTRTHR